MEMQPIDPNKPMNTTLTAQQWNTVMAALEEVAMPHRLSHPIIDSLMTQLRGQMPMPDDTVEDIRPSRTISGTSR